MHIYYAQLLLLYIVQLCISNQAGRVLINRLSGWRTKSSVDILQTSYLL